MSAHKNKLINLILTSVIVLISSSSQAQKRVDWQQVSIIEILADPSKFDDKIVVIRGFVVWQDDVKKIFLNTESIFYTISRNAIDMNVEDLSEDTKNLIASKGKYSCCTLRGKIEAYKHNSSTTSSCLIRVVAIHNIDKVSIQLKTSDNR